MPVIESVQLCRAIMSLYSVLRTRYVPLTHTTAELVLLGDRTLSQLPVLDLSLGRGTWPKVRLSNYGTTGASPLGLVRSPTINLQLPSYASA